MQPKEPNVEIATSKDVDMFVAAAMDPRPSVNQPSRSTSSGSSMPPSPGPQREAEEAKPEEDTSVAVAAAEVDVEEAASADEATTPLQRYLAESTNIDIEYGSGI